MKTQTIIALKFLMVMTLLTGIIYPLFMTGVAQITFPAKANGSLIMKDGKIIGSELIGQKLDIKDLAEMAADTTRAERCSAAKKVLVSVRDSPDLPCHQDALPSADLLLQRR